MYTYFYYEILFSYITTQKIVLYLDGTNVEVVFTFKDDAATEMAVIGDFVGWVEPGVPMAKNADGKWEVSVKSTVDGVLKYKFWYKGTYIYDFKSPDKIDDGFGGNNGLIEVSKVLAKQKAAELAASGDAAGAAALMAQANAGSSGCRFMTWSMIGAQGKFITEGKADPTKKGMDLDTVEFGAKSYMKFTGDAVPGMPVFVEIAAAEAGLDDSAIALLKKNEYGENTVEFKDAFVDFINNTIASPIATLSKANDQAGGNPTRGDNPYLGHLKMGITTDYVEVLTGFNYAKPSTHQAIIWKTVDGDSWDAGYNHAGGFLQISNGAAIREIGGAKLNVTIAPNKSADRKGTKFGMFNYATLDVAGITADIQYNNIFDGDAFFKDVVEQDIIFGAKGMVGPVALAGQGLVAIHTKEFTTTNDNAQDYFGYSTDVFWRTKDFGLKNLAGTVKATYSDDLVDATFQYRLRGAQASMLFLRENHDDSVWTLSDTLGRLNSQRVDLSATLKAIYGVDLSLNASADMRLAKLSDEDYATMATCWSWYPTDHYFRYEDGMEFEFKPAAKVSLLDLVGFDATVDAYTTLNLTTMTNPYAGDAEFVYEASDSAFLMKNVGVKVGFGALNDVITGIDVIYGLDNSDSKLAFNTLLTQVKFPKNFNADLGLGLRSVKGTEAAEGYNADALNAFGFSVGVSKKIEKLQKPVIYGQFVFNMDPYKGFGDGQEQFNLDGYVLGDGVKDFDGEAACRVGIRWDI